MSESVTRMHHLWRKLHLHLLATLPELLDRFFECIGSSCVSV